jgi:hypothetical protein
VSAGQVIAAVADGTDAARGGPWREWLDRARGGLLLVQAAHLLADRGSWPARTALAGIATILRTEHDPGVVFAAERGRLDLLRDHPAMARLLAADRVVSLAPTLADAAFRLVLGYLRGDLVDWVPAAETAIWSVLRAQYQAEGEYFQAEEAARSLFGRTIDEWQPGGGPVEPAHVPSYRAADPGKASST